MAHRRQQPHFQANHAHPSLPVITNTTTPQPVLGVLGILVAGVLGGLGQRVLGVRVPLPPVPLTTPVPLASPLIAVEFTCSGTQGALGVLGVLWLVGVSECRGSTVHSGNMTLYPRIPLAAVVPLPNPAPSFAPPFHPSFVL